MTDADRLDAAFAALANPTRRAILARLMDGEATVNALAEPFDMTLPAISQHIRVLEEAGLITRRKEAQKRLCSLNAEPIKTVSSWAEAYRPIWEARFNRMDTLLKAMKERRDD